MINIERYVNELMTSNCYVIWDDVTLECIVIDPASEKSLSEIEFIDSHHLTLDYILLTHEHTDHTWGVNALLDMYGTAKVVCTETCKSNLPKAGDTYFRLYYDDGDYTYSVRRVDLTAEELGWKIGWGERIVRLLNTQGHSFGSMCVDIEGALFTGDALMQYKPVINKRNGSRELYDQSIAMICDAYPAETCIYPGHGVPFILKDKDILL